jgi:hypothetical protein
MLSRALLTRHGHRLLQTGVVLILYSGVAKIRRAPPVRSAVDLTLTFLGISEAGLRLPRAALR